MPGLACRLQILAERAYRGLDDHIVEGIVKQQCLKVLPEYIRKPLYFQSIANPEMTLSSLIRIGTTLARLEPPLAGLDVLVTSQQSRPSAASPAQPPPVPPSSVSVDWQSDTCSYCRKLGHIRDNCYRLNKACFKCGQRGHFRSQCLSLSPDGARGGVRPRDRPTRTVPPGGSGPSCSFCGVAGHIMASCPAFEEYMKKLISQASNPDRLW